MARYGALVAWANALGYKQAAKLLQQTLDEEKKTDLLLNKLREADKIDWSRAVVDSTSVRAVFGGRRPARIRRIDGKWGANITFSPMAMASRWPSR